MKQLRQFNGNCTIPAISFQGKIFTKFIVREEVSTLLQLLEHHITSLDDEEDTKIILALYVFYVF